MSKKWKAFILLSLSLNLVCFVSIASLSRSFVDAQLENLGLFLKLSADQQSLRREFNATRAKLQQVDEAEPQ